MPPPSSKENAYLRDVVENCEGETGENEPEKEKESDDGFVNVAIFDVAQTVARDVVAQADGGDGDEDEVGRVQKGPLVFQDEEYQAWKDDWEKENLRKSRVSPDLSTLRCHKRNTEKPPPAKMRKIPPIVARWRSRTFFFQN